MSGKVFKKQGDTKNERHPHGKQKHTLFGRQTLLSWGCFSTQLGFCTKGLQNLSFLTGRLLLVLTDVYPSMEPWVILTGCRAWLASLLNSHNVFGSISLGFHRSKMEKQWLLKVVMKIQWDMWGNSTLWGVHSLGMSTRLLLASSTSSKTCWPLNLWPN